MKKGFTLIELLVVIGIMAVLMAGVVALIDPVDKNMQANDANVQALVASFATAEESYAATHNGCYAQNWTDLVSVGELKVALSLPSGYAAWTYTTTAGTCTAPEYGNVVVCATLRSKRYSNPGTKYLRYDPSTGKTTTTNTAC